MSTADEVRQAVREQYGKIARSPSGCGPGCCAETTATPTARARAVGYSEEQLEAVAEDGNLGLGCGNPHGIAALKRGEVVLDLGSGAGFDAFLAARQVGETGRVIGVDMTPEMVGRARRTAAGGGYENVEFRLGEIEYLPLADDAVDVIISNCVINLSPDKDRVFREAFRVLKPGGRLAVADVVAAAELPGMVRTDLAQYAGCVAGAWLVPDVERSLAEAGFTQIRVRPRATNESSQACCGRSATEGAQVISAHIEAVKEGS